MPKPPYFTPTTIVLREHDTGKTSARYLPKTAGRN